MRYALKLKGHQNAVRRVELDISPQALHHPPSLRYGATFSRFADAP
jgi:hypothetical protein